MESAVEKHHIASFFSRENLMVLIIYMMTGELAVNSALPIYFVYRPVYEMVNLINISVGLKLKCCTESNFTAVYIYYH